MNKPITSDHTGRREGTNRNFPPGSRWHFVPAGQYALEVLPALFHEKLPIIYANIRV
ncbi:MAG TPA: hypothetical protein VK183_09550 [Flavobacterium sp.]|nr:hypothetical protein [Flavobacterium sp.]